MSCAAIEDRLFDEDCRDALLGRSSPPADIAEHIAGCPACRQQWAAAVAETRALRECLVVAPPSHVWARLYQARRPKAHPPVRQTAADVLSWAVFVGVAGAVLMPPGLPEWMGFCAGVGLGLTLTIFRRVQQPRSMIRSLTRCALRLARVTSI